MIPPGRSESHLGGSDGVRRREVLGAATAGAILGSADVASGQETIELVGGTDGWVGRSPDDVAGETNPTLVLDPGTDYAVVCENADGAAHNLVVEDGDGDRLVRSDLVEREGATQTVEFTATAEMTTYYCEVHPNSMRGNVDAGQGTPTPEGETTPYPEQGAIPRGPSVRLEPVVEGLISPVAFEPAPGETELQVVVDQVGRVYRYDDGLVEDPFLDVRDRLVNIGEGTWADYDERGLLGLAFHPEFADNRTFYVRYSAPPREGNPFQDYGHTAVVAEFQATEDATYARDDSERIVLEEPLPGPVHNGGGLAFGPDGYLYVGIADGSSHNGAGPGHVEDWYDGNPGGNAQNVEANRLGGILRIDVDGRDGEKGYAIPEDNPLVGRPGHDEYYAWGIRNPWRFSFDSEGRLFEGDPGGRRFEEVNLVEKGGNYGWNVKEGTHCFDAEDPGQPKDDCPDSTPDDVRGGENLRDPVVEYPHWDDNGRPVGTAVIGGYFYESGGVPDLTDRYVFGDFSRAYERPAGSLFVASPSDGDLWSMETLVIEGRPEGRLGRFVFGFGRDADGELYLLSNETGGPNGETGTVHRIVEASEGTETRTGTKPGTGEQSDGDGTDAQLLLLSLFGGLIGLGSYLFFRRGSDGA
ncbi:hypothetical protein BRC81_02680 [Halobacteriales archaeon QS_1_68_20]|nr:MAG: hypothetical protein BRC81_02680 [Halobacteriales archaeon QS_1_68_20]